MTFANAVKNNALHVKLDSDEVALVKHRKSNGLAGLIDWTHSRWPTVSVAYAPFNEVYTFVPDRNHPPTTSDIEDWVRQYFKDLSK